VGLFKRSRKAFKSFKRFAQDIEVLPAHQPLSEAASGKGLVYEVNPIYLEAGQGGTSSMRGVGAIVMAFGLGAMWYRSYNLMFSKISTTFSFMLGVLLFIMGTLILLPYLYATFFNVTDVITRYDRKRQKVWMWSRHGAIEMD
jgi:hypothetical protein